VDSGRVICRELATHSEVRALERQWRLLWTHDPEATPFQSFDWIDAWLTHYRHYWKSLCFIVCEEDGRAVGIAPLYVRRRSLLRGRTSALLFVGTGEDERDESFAEYMAPLCLPEYRSICNSLFHEQISRRNRREQIEFLRVRADLTEPLIQEFRESQKKCVSHVLGANYVMPTGLDNALASIGSKQRNSLKRKMKRLRNLPGFCVEVADDEASRLTFFAQLVELHNRSWQSRGRPGAFSASTFIAFHDQVTKAFMKQNQLLLARISSDDGVVAVIYGLCDRYACRYYQSGIMLGSQAALSPGLVSHLLVADIAAERGLTTYDLMLSSASGYKARLGQRDSILYSYLLSA
jgi:CelD/BcsL family acetyltransferase involved in cellulose biosynthesis